MPAIKDAMSQTYPDEQTTKMFVRYTPLHRPYLHESSALIAARVIHVL